MTAPSLAPPEPRTPTPTAWWRGAAVYQIYPRSFADSNGDGVGDLNGITDRLAHVASLGVDAVWISPFYASPMRDFGYDVSDHCAVDPLFGTLADFDRLLARAHGLGLKVILDQVHSHTSDQHPWFSESRASRGGAKADWYVWADPKPDGTPPNNWQSVFGGPAWTWDARRRQYYLHNFLAGQPDLNLHNWDVQDALLDVARFWLARGIDGFRLDAVNFLMHDPLLRDNPVSHRPGPRTRPFDFQDPVYSQGRPEMLGYLARLRALAASYGDRFLLAEIGGALAQDEAKRVTAPPEGLHSAYSFAFLYAEALTPALVAEAVQAWRDGPSEGWPSWTFSNHDAPRAVSRWRAGRDPKAMAKLALLLLCSLRGTIILYQGEELGLPQAEIAFARLQDPEAIANWPLTLGRDGARTPMPWEAQAAYAGFSRVEPWLPLGADHARLAVDLQARDPASTLALAKRVLALRRARPALRTGAMRIAQAAPALLVFERGEAEDRLLCAFNLGHAPVAWRPPAGWRVVEAVNWDGGEALGPLAGVIAEPGPPEIAANAISFGESGVFAGPTGAAASAPRR